MFDYERKVEKNIKRNKKFIDEFEQWLIEKGFAKKTIRKHLSNIDLYINDYLNYYDITKMEDGMVDVYSFLNVWFIEKCLLTSRNSLKEMVSSVKKFYQCMSEKEYVKKEDYKELCNLIKDNMDEFLDSIDEFDNGTYYDLFD